MIRDITFAYVRDWRQFPNLSQDTSDIIHCCLPFREVAFITGRSPPGERQHNQHEPTLTRLVHFLPVNLSRYRQQTPILHMSGWLQAQPPRFECHHKLRNLLDRLVFTRAISLAPNCHFFWLLMFCWSEVWCLILDVCKYQISIRYN